MVWFVVILAHWLYANECCADEHCHPVPCDQVKDLGNGWQWWDYVFDKSELKVSPDGNCHVCVSGPKSLCIYLPART
jgi:hypothetical protein